MQALSLADSWQLGVQGQIKNKWKHIHEKSDSKECKVNLECRKS